jgi:membrane protease YdiL (CAAX protease family)
VTLRTWHSLPTVIRAVLAGVVVSSVGTLPWALLVSLNLKYAPTIPWAVPITAVYLWFFWKYVRGSWWPRETAEAREQNCRARSLPEDVWAASIGAGILGLWSVLLFQGVYGRMVELPSQHAEDLSNVPVLTLFVSYLMSAVVAGVTEESGFRGYMQRPIEQKYGPVVAIIVTASIFGFMHFVHREVTFVLMPWYMGIALVYGMIAYLTGSILPTIVLHAGGNMLGAFQILMSGRAEWNTISLEKKPIWETGADASFWLATLGFIIVTAAAIWAYAGLARTTKRSRTQHGINAHSS